MSILDALLLSGMLAVLCPVRNKVLRVIFPKRSVNDRSFESARIRRFAPHKAWSDPENPTDVGFPEALRSALSPKVE